MAKLKTLAIAGLCLALSACSLFNKEEDVIVMAEVPEFDNQFDSRISWQVSVGKGVKDYYSQLTPLVAYDTLFAAERFGKVQAYDLSGKLLWTQDLSKVESNNQFRGNTNNARISGGLVGAYQRVYLGTENADVFALDAETGEIVWQAQVSGEVLSAPAVDDSIVAVQTANGRLVALDAHTGEQLWESVIDLPNLMLRSASSPLISAGAVIVGRADGRVGLYLQQNGQLMFEYTLAQSRGATEIDRLVDVDSTPVLVGSQLYGVAYNGNLVSVDLRSGAEAWRQSYSAYQDLLVSGSRIYLSDMKDYLFSVDRRQGEQQWSQQALSYRQLTPVAIDGDYLMVGDSEGYLYWLDRSNGQFVSKTRLDKSGLYSRPIVSGDNVFVQARNGKLYALERR
ncbi:outer membrane protein assembly factor BamB [Aliagarivorans marinus]|uniref:outer membrane protein assembly factor BamB n=1 Tax=Aliagarivorans marinus TaxID=561965 RepID=UPI00047C2509|nr:outer membrane protein assembly factor BamB [Aliagarivorans marinus]